MGKYSSSQLLQVFISDSQLLSMITSGYWRWEPLKTVTSGSQSFSVVAMFPKVLSDYHTVMVTSEPFTIASLYIMVASSQWMSAVISGSQWLPVLLNCYQYYFLLFYFRVLYFRGWSQPQNYFNSENFLIYGSQWLPIAFNAASNSPCLPRSGCQWFSMFLYGSQWF